MDLGGWKIRIDLVACAIKVTGIAEPMAVMGPALILWREGGKELPPYLLSKRGPQNEWVPSHN